MSHWKTWLLVSVAAVFVEILPPAKHFFFACVAFGALAASIVTFFYDVSWAAWVIFAVVTLALVPILMPLARFLFAKRPAVDPAALSGQRGTVEETISSGRPGTVSIRGELWRARSEGETLQPREEVLVSAVEGDHLVVRRAL